MTQGSDKKFVQRMRKTLEQRAQELRRGISRTQSQGRSIESGLQGDALDRSSTDSAKELLFNLSTQERRLLDQTEIALQRITEGTFGECDNCGEAINPKRLDAVPWAQYCIDCQEKIENGSLGPNDAA